MWNTDMGFAEMLDEQRRTHSLVNAFERVLAHTDRAPVYHLVGGVHGLAQKGRARSQTEGGEPYPVGLGTGTQVDRRSGGIRAWKEVRLHRL